MRQNMGTIDRAIRVIVAISVGLLWYTGVISGVAAMILGAISIVLVATSLIGSCPLYMPFSFSTKKKN